MHVQELASDHRDQPLLDGGGPAPRSQALHYGGAVLEIDDTQAALLTARIAELCRRRRTALHTVYGRLPGEHHRPMGRTAVQLVVGHGIPVALVPSAGGQSR